MQSCSPIIKLRTCLKEGKNGLHTKIILGSFLRNCLDLFFMVVIFSSVGVVLMSSNKINYALTKLKFNKIKFSNIF